MEWAFFFKNTTPLFLPTCRHAHQSPSERIKVNYPYFLFETIFLLLPYFYVTLVINKCPHPILVAYFSWISVCKRLFTIPTHAEHSLCIYISTTTTQHTSYLYGTLLTHQLKLASQLGISQVAPFALIFWYVAKTIYLSWE